MRIALLLCWSLVAACSVGIVGDPATGTDGGGMNPNGCVNRATTTLAHETHPTTYVKVTGNVSNAGQDCISAGCHLTGNLGDANAPAYQFAGTVMKANGMPDIGATILLKGANGKSMPSPTDDAGNFYVMPSEVTSAGLTFPVSVSATACPNITPMISTIVDPTAGGSCNKAGCHVAAAQGVVMITGD